MLLSCYVNLVFCSRSLSDGSLNLWVKSAEILGEDRAVRVQPLIILNKRFMRKKCNN